MNVNVINTDSDVDFTLQGAAYLKHAIAETLTVRNHCILGLSGGSTPKPIYEALRGGEMGEWISR